MAEPSDAGSVQAGTSVVGALDRRPDRVALDRDRVVEIAGDLVDEQGLDQFRLSSVAERAGVTQPALYRHVDSVADVWRALGLDTRRRLAECLATACVGRSGTDAVAAVAHAWRLFAREHPGRYRSTERYPVIGDADLERAVERVIEILSAALGGFDLDEDSTRHAAIMLRSALHGFVSFELGEAQVGPVDETFDQLISMLSAAFSRGSVREPPTH